MLTKEQLAEIEQRAEKATPGPWGYDGMHNEIFSPKAENWFLICSELREHPGEKILDKFGHRYNADFDFIASARTDIPALLEHIRELEAQLAKAKRRAEKAVADLKYIAVCETCKKSGVTEYPESAVIQCEYYDSECGCGKYEWRGDAEEGDAK